MMLSLIIGLVVLGLAGALVYEFIFWRKKVRYARYIEMFDSGQLIEMPKGYTKEPERLKGFVYFLVVAGIGWGIVTGVAFLAFGACMMLIAGVSL